MRLLVQRVKEASVTIGGTLRSRIGAGLLVLVGVENADQRDVFEVMPFGDHLRPDQDIRLPFGKRRENVEISVLGRSRIVVHP